MSRNLATNFGSLDSLNWRIRCGCRPCLRQMRCTELTLMPLALAMAAAVQCVTSPGGSVSVSATTRAATSAPSGGMRDGRVLSRSRPSTPSGMKRSCQRQTARLADAGVAHDLGGAAAVRRQQHDLARQTCFCGAVPIRHHRLQTSTIGGTHFNC